MRDNTPITRAELYRSLAIAGVLNSVAVLVLVFAVIAMGGF
jgi:hypothetical protein